MNLLETLDDLLQGWRPVFAQIRTFERGYESIDDRCFRLRVREW